jgi:hypothetical protein
VATQAVGLTEVDVNDIPTFGHWLVRWDLDCVNVENEKGLGIVLSFSVNVAQ